MKTTNHTPGPWTPNDQLTHGYRAVFAHNNKEFIICMVHEDNREDKGNTALIAAAPDLLSALSALVDWLEESGLSKTPGGGVGPFKHLGTTYSVIRDAQAAIQKATEKE